jgi:hypothetical protein
MIGLRRAALSGKVVLVAKLDINAILAAAEAYEPVRRGKWDNEWAAVDALMTQRGMKLRQAVEFLCTVPCGIKPELLEECFSALKARKWKRDSREGGKTHVERSLAAAKYELNWLRGWLATQRISVPQVPPM